MWLELVSLLVGVITSLMNIQVLGLEYSGNSVAFMVATVFYFLALWADSLLAKKFGVKSRPNVIGSRWWGWWCLAGFIGVNLQLILGPKLPWYGGVVTFVTGLVVSGVVFIVALIIISAVKDHYYSRPKTFRS